MERLAGNARGLALCLMMLPVATAPADWQSLPQASTLQFTARYQQVELPGRFDRFDVALGGDPSWPQTLTLQVTVRVDSADMDDPDLNEGIAGPDWFDFAGHPVASFVSDEVRATGPDAFIATGTLTLKGQARPVDVPFEWRAGAGQAHMEGRLSLSRRDFGIGSGDWWDDDTIGDPVTVTFCVTLEQAD